MARFVGLENVEASHQRDPRSFSIPRGDQRRNIRPGDIVKLVFSFSPKTSEGYDAERMWVEVTRTMADGYVGTLSNDPSIIADLHAGAQIDFQAQHVAALWVPNDCPGIPYGKFAVVSRVVTEQDAWPGEVVRNEPPDDRFSGWIILSGDESEGFRRDLNNFVPLSIDELIQRFAILDSVLDEPVGTSWKWDSNVLEYTPVVDRPTPHAR